MTTSTVTETLKERGQTYGRFPLNAEISQKLKTVLRNHKGWENLSADKKEALEMIVYKISRILNGNPNHSDSWHDIAGYATLAEKECS